MKTDNRTRMLRAMKGILKEYREERHAVSGFSCKLCKLYGNYGQPDSCTGCPMKVFGNTSFPCTNRKCQPVDCRKDNDTIYVKTVLKLERVVEFYTQAIAYVETLTDEQTQNIESFKPLIDIDKAVGNKYIIDGEK
jgi:hypothetical protein